MFDEANRIDRYAAAIARLKEQVYHKLCDLHLTAYKTREPVPFDQRTTGERAAVGPGDRWGELFDCAWVHVEGQLPPAAAGQKVVLLIDLNGEGLVCDAQGRPLQGITNIHSEFDRRMGVPGKRTVPFCEAAAGGENIDLWIDAGCNDLFGNLQEDGCIKEAFAAVCDEEARALYYDLTVLYRYLRLLPQQDPRRYQLLDVIGGALNALNAAGPGGCRAARAVTADYLARGCGDAPVRIHATGHAHIDLAWLWPLRETRRKGARTFATALQLMERYPAYRFGSSQPQLYQWIKEDHPALYGQVRARVLEGRWELQGAMWVESDTNIPCGESLVRQFLYGNRYWRREFGREAAFAWLPDVFGYSAAFPQIMRKAGIRYFSTIKLSWNTHNRFPYTTFRWRGLGGAEVLAHMPPEGNYLSEASPEALAACAQNMAVSGQYGDVLLPFGIGDGGGGPSPSHLEYLAREQHLPGLMPVEQGSIADFFAAIDRPGARYPAWEGELYLEKHQGTYTTAARSKRYNRRLEWLLHDTEFLCAMAMRLLGRAYPQSELEAVWKEALLYQFHDILPGSSIDRVYDESHARYAALTEEAAALRGAAVNALADSIDSSGCARPLLLVNTLSFPRRVSVSVDGGTAFAQVPPMGYAVVDLDALTAAEEEVRADAAARRIENRALQAAFAADGSLVSLVDKRSGRERLAGPSNQMLLYRDEGDAWDFPGNYRETPPTPATLQQMDIAVEEGAAVCRQVYTYGASRLALSIRLAPGEECLDITCEADWHERDTMLRVQFVPAVAFQRIDCDIQFGHISRSTQSNTTREQAQCEICAHKWLEVADAGGSFALLSDCKYGFYAKDGIVDMNALRSPRHPAKEMDQGAHTFRYAVRVGEPGSRLDTIHRAYELNCPPILLPMAGHGGSLPREQSFLQADDPQIIIETVKKAEDSDAIVVRSYETLGAGTQGQVALQFPHGTVRACDLMEAPGGPVSGARAYGPFELHSLLVE